MRSRPARLTVCLLVWLVFGAAAFLIFSSEQRLSDRRALLHAFDTHARAALDALADMRAAQQAYVAQGQGVAFWMPRVAALNQTATNAVDRLRESAASPDALESLVQAANTITEFGNVDKRARDYIKSDQPLMAADVVFSEGGETAAASTREVEAAVTAELRAFDAFQVDQRKLEFYAAGGAGSFGALMLALMALASSGTRKTMVPASSEVPQSSPPGGQLGLRDAFRSSEAPPPAPPTLKAAADLCTDFGRIKDLDDLTRLLGRVADILEASGLIVWLGNTTGADLRPVIAHGYPSETLARLPAIPRSADNAAAAAYRGGSLRIVLARPGTSGAVVAPLLAPEGCIGALTAEIKAGGEASDRVQSLMAIFAAQLTGVLAPASPDLASEQRIANS